jgi:hypothetical protein
MATEGTGPVASGTEYAKKLNKLKFKAKAKAVGVIASGISDSLSPFVDKGLNVDINKGGESISSAGRGKKAFDYDPFDEQKSDDMAGKKPKKSKKY